MKANYTPPEGVIQLTYNVSLKEITRLKKIIEEAKSRDGMLDKFAVVSIKCGKQSDSNYKKWYNDTELVYILNFNYKEIHVYMKLVHIIRAFSRDSGIRYKIIANTIKELPK
jgi:hypothetical protein